MSTFTAPTSPSAQPPGGAADELTRRLGEVARLLASERGAAALLEAIVTTALGTVDGAEHATLTTVTRKGAVTTAAATGDVATAIDDIQRDVGEGPCLTALFEGRTVVIDDLATDGRFPAFAARAVEIGVMSMLCVQVYVRGDELGALNLASATPGAFTDDSRVTGELFAAQATLALSGAEREERLRTALDTRDRIGQAMGILMERYSMDADRAFAVLARLSQDSNRKLHEIATELVVTRTLDLGAHEPTS